MANICDNHFYFSAENNADFYERKFKDILKNELDGEITYMEKYDESKITIEGYFESRWSFPMHIFEKLFDTSDDCYFRCLSEEYGMGYVGMNIYEDEAWRDEQTFNI